MKKIWIPISIFVGLAVAWLLLRETEKPLPPLENPRLVIKKKERKLFVYDGERLIKTYRIALGANPLDDKQVEGDGKTPEGEFYVAAKNPKSKFHLSLGLNYPTVAAAERGLRENLISPAEHEEILKATAQSKMPPQKTRLGGEIYIHGGGAKSDWTQGCVALENKDIAELFDALPHHVRVRIEP